MRADVGVTFPVEAIDAAAFWRLVDCRGPEECWPWKGSLHKAGYGEWRRQHGGKRYVLRASRVAFALTHGRWPDEYALHDCDFPRCCNPAHIYDGDQGDNARDMAARGRTTYQRRPEMRLFGAKNPNAMLTAVAVAAIREERATLGTTYKKLAEKHGIAPATVSHIIRGRTWSDRAAQ